MSLIMVMTPCQISAPHKITLPKTLSTPFHTHYQDQYTEHSNTKTIDKMKINYNHVKNNVIKDNYNQHFQARREAALSLWAELWQFLLNNYKNSIEQK